MRCIEESRVGAARVRTGVGTGTYRYWVGRCSKGSGAPGQSRDQGTRAVKGPGHQGSQETRDQESPGSQETRDQESPGSQRTRSSLAVRGPGVVWQSEESGH